MQITRTPATNYTFYTREKYRELLMPEIARLNVGNCSLCSQHEPRITVYDKCNVRQRGAIRYWRKRRRYRSGTETADANSSNKHNTQHDHMKFIRNSNSVNFIYKMNAHEMASQRQCLCRPNVHTFFNSRLLQIAREIRYAHRFAGPSAVSVQVLLWQSSRKWKMSISFWFIGKCRRLW